MELTVPLGGSPHRHVHETLDDSFLLLDGEIVVRCGEQTALARPHLDQEAEQARTRKAGEEG